ncbi:hypothetical protein FHETE_4838 [Fusarium heterosporum]|uniref:Uncharacterized protein n=1 Tax=Fusarium heterosporum TaxID=42747 RepID=A0A8H5THG4_FUSHE|nr:hypothetical protein FHETE_4838 [Fusarium heterosporum]
MVKRSISDTSLASDNEPNDEEIPDPDLDQTTRKSKKRKIPTLDKITGKCTIDTHPSALDHRLTAQESFCELLRWWRYSIMQSFNVQLVDFTVVRRERHERVGTRTVTEIVYKAIDQSSLDKRELGYIQFLNTMSSKAGVVKIVSRQSTLQPETLLALPTPDKSQDHLPQPVNNLARAMLNFVGSGTNHSVSCQSGGVNMNFNFNTERELIARMSRMSPTAISKSIRSTSSRVDSLIPFYPRPSIDTILSIGETGEGRAGNNKWIKRDKVSLMEFGIWCECALFLQVINEEDIVRTPAGDLILDSKFRDNIYHRGFILHERSKTTNSSLSDKQLRYGYNIVHGAVDKEKKHMSSLQEESRAFMSIWDSAFKQRPQLVGLLSGLLNDWQWGDVELAQQSITRDTVVRLRDYLFKDTSKWYYPTSARQNPQLDQIIAGLGRQGRELKDSYWNILQAHGMVYTAELEHQRRFLASKCISIPDHDLTAYTSRAQEAPLADERPMDHKQKYVGPDMLSLDLTAISEGTGEYQSIKFGLVKLLATKNS